MLASSILAVVGLAATVVAAPTKHTATITAQDLIKIAPDTESCAGAEYQDECATAAVGAPNIAKSFKEYNIKSFGAQAAIVSIVLFESGDFKYTKHHFPSPNPGQGTRNMQSPEFNQKYADYLAAKGKCGLTAAKVSTAQAQGPDAVLALVNNDHLGFGSAAWFLRTQCDASIIKGLASGTETGYNNYLTTCIGTTSTPDRLAGWNAVMALKHW